MAMVVKNNMSAVRTLNTLNSNTSALQKSLQKVSSGMKINSAQDDASGYAISERMRVRIRSLDQANQNSQNDSSLMKTAEGAVGNTVEILRALKEKAINAANDSNTDEDRQTIQKEINQFIDQIDDNALVQFNGKYLVDGSKNNATQDTKTILLNQSLQKGTKAASALTNLNNRAGDSLGIQTTDKYQVSWVQNGSIKFTSGDVGENTIKDILSLKGTAMTVDSDGNKHYDDTDISQVSATGAEGLISGPTDDTNTTDKFIEVFTYDSEVNAAGEYGTDNEIIALAKAKIDDANDNDVSTDASGNKVVQLNKIVDSDSMGYYASYNGTDGTAFGDAVTVNYNPQTSKYSFDGPTPDAPVYKQNVNYDSSGDPYQTTTYEDTGFSYDSDTTYNYQTGTDVISKAAASKYNTTAGGNQDFSLKDLGFYKDSDGTEFTNEKITVAFAGAITVTGLSQGDGLFTANPHTVTPDPVAASETGLEDASDKFGKAVYTPDHEDGVAFGSLYAGVDNQISGLTISILDQDGNVKKAANAALDQFKQYQRAENKTGDMSLNFHIGSEANVAFKVGMGDMRSQALGLKGSDGTRIDVYTKEHANAAINVIENALTKALDQQTTIGAIEARLEYTSTNLTTSSENVQAAESTIRDADMAKEMTNYTKSNVLLQAAQAMLAQANQNSSAVLSLLQ